jgi:hypothetical protein
VSVSNIVGIGIMSRLLKEITEKKKEKGLADFGLVPLTPSGHPSVCPRIEFCT